MNEPISWWMFKKHWSVVHSKDCFPFNDSIETVHAGCCSYYRIPNVFNLLSLPPYASMCTKLNGKWTLRAISLTDARIRSLKRHNFPFSLVIHLPSNGLYPALCLFRPQTHIGILSHICNPLYTSSYISWAQYINRTIQCTYK